MPTIDDAGGSSLTRTEREELAELRLEVLRLRCEADETRLVEERLLAQMRDANQHLVHATVDAQVQADSAIELGADAEGQFRALVRASAAIVWHADARGRIDVDRPQWEAFTGEAVHAEDPEWWLHAVHPDDRRHVRGVWDEAVTTGHAYVCQHRLHRRAGGYASVISRAIPIPRAAAKHEWLGMMTDITDSVRLEEAREQFIGVLGHDLRNPLAAIFAGLDLLRSLPEPQAAVVTRLARSADRMMVIIRDVMDFARGRLGGGIPVVLGRCDLGRACLHVVDEIHQAHPDRTLSCELDGDLVGTWDRDRLEQALSNVLGNAIAHGADPIELRARGEADEVCIAITNRGEPIAEAVLATLFEPFVRGVRGPRQGLGLGLYIVKEIVQSHRGIVTAASAAETGTTFTLRIPRDPDAASA